MSVIKARLKIPNKEGLHAVNHSEKYGTMR